MKKCSLVILITLIQISFQKCEGGCLSCGKENLICLMCDTSKNYYLRDGSCILSSEGSCLVSSQAGRCLQCIENNYLDSNTLKCLRVSDVNSQTNCFLFSSSQACLQCKAGHFQKGSSCSPVVNPVSNCQFYISDGLCKQCSQGYILNQSQTTCISTSSVQNCLTFKYDQCLKCASKFILNYNGYASNLKDSNYFNTFMNARNDQFMTKIPFSQANVCLSGNIPNCSVYTNVITCFKCLDKFFLSDNKCIAFPDSTISNCQDYEDAKTCDVCKPKFYLSNNACVKVGVIEGCLSYSQSSSFTQCLSCDQANFLNANACQVRVNSVDIANCLKTDPSADKCSKCAFGFDMTADGLACLDSIVNCETYKPGTTKTSTKLECQKCKESAYLNSQDSGVTFVCTLGTISNCKVYSTSANTCLTCNDRYYLINNVCNAHSVIPSCSVYSSSVANTCALCSSGSYNFNLVTICKQTVIIPQCTEYSQTGLTCLACSEGFLVDSGKCQGIVESLQNCLAISGVNCIQCKVGFMVNTLVSPNVCIQTFSYLKNYCTLDSSVTNAVWPSTQSTNFLKCATCYPGLIPYSPLNNEAVCIKTAELNLYSSMTTVPNCFRYGFGYNSADTNGLVCMQCSGDYVLASTGYSLTIANSKPTSCIVRASCPTETGDNSIIIDDLFGFVNVCVASSTNIFSGKTCQYFGRKTSFTPGSTNFDCLLPSNGNKYKYSFSTTVMSYESNSPIPTDVKSTSVDCFQGYSELEGPRGLLTPDIFNWRGYSSSMVISALPNPVPVELNNCDIIWTVGEFTSFKGTAFMDGTPYAKLTASKSACLRCSFGFQPKFAINEATGNSVLPICTSMGLTCSNNNFRVGGLPTYLNSILSCHACAANNGVKTFPTIVMEYIGSTSSPDKGNFLQFSLPAVDSITKTASTVQGFSCLVAPTTVVSSTDAITVGSQVNNCGVYGVLSSITTTLTSPSSTHSYCLACLNGYYPIYLGTQTDQLVVGTTTHPSYIVKTCNQSKKCDENTLIRPFNSCGKCTTQEESNSIPVYYGFNDYSLTNCNQASTKSCFILNYQGVISGTSANECLICMSGFILNADKKCETLSPPQRNPGSSFSFAYYYGKTKSLTPSANFDVIFVRIHYLLAYSGLQYGVSACESGFTLASPHKTNIVSNLSADKMCFESSYIKSNALSESTVFIPNCLQYSFSSSTVYFCDVCISGYIITANKKNCVEFFPGCLVSMDLPTKNSCNTCITGYMNFGGKCTNQKISFCEIHGNNQVSFVKTAMECDVCASGYYLTTDKSKCVLGSVLGCDTYAANSGTDCTTAKNGFVLITVPNSIKYAYPVVEETNCLQLLAPAADNASPASFKCSKCKWNSSVARGTAAFNPADNPTAPRTICMPFYPQDNCQNYNQNNVNFLLNTFDCSECISGFYLNSLKKCTSRTVRPLKCTLYNPSLDVCLACSSGSYLVEDGSDCKDYPIGINNCNNYKSLTECTSCDSGYFLNNNVCVLSTLIADCEIYSANRVCQQCRVGYFLKSSILCQVATATSCKTYKSAESCESCNAGFLLIPNGVNFNCVRATVTNCAVVSTENNKTTCETCSPRYYWNSTACADVDEEILGCIKYDSKNTCSSCDLGRTRSVDRKKCDSVAFLSTQDPNCVDSISSDQPICDKCDLGFYFNGDKCIRCSGSDKDNGCWVCDTDKPSNCLVCSTGYYQNGNGECISLNPETPFVKRVSILNSLFLLLVVLNFN